MTSPLRVCCHSAALTHSSRPQSTRLWVHLAVLDRVIALDVHSYSPLVGYHPPLSLSLGRESCPVVVRPGSTVARGRWVDSSSASAAGVSASPIRLARCVTARVRLTVAGDPRLSIPLPAPGWSLVELLAELDGGLAEALAGPVPGRGGRVGESMGWYVGWPRLVTGRHGGRRELTAGQGGGRLH